MMKEHSKSLDSNCQMSHDQSFDQKLGFGGDGPRVLGFGPWPKSLPQCQLVTKANSGSGDFLPGCLHSKTWPHRCHDGRGAWAWRWTDGHIPVVHSPRGWQSPSVFGEQAFAPQSRQGWIGVQSVVISDISYKFISYKFIIFNIIYVF